MQRFYSSGAIEFAIGHIVLILELVYSCVLIKNMGFNLDKCSKLFATYLHFIRMTCLFLSLFIFGLHNNTFVVINL